MNLDAEAWQRQMEINKKGEAYHDQYVSVHVQKYNIIMHQNKG